MTFTCEARSKKRARATRPLARARFVSLAVDGNAPPGSFAGNVSIGSIGTTGRGFERGAYQLPSVNVPLDAPSVDVGATLGRAARTIKTERGYRRDVQSVERNALARW